MMGETNRNNKLKKETKITEQEDEYGPLESKIKKFECPFTWEMEEINETLKTDYKPHDEEDRIPILKLFRVTMMIFVNLKAKKNLETMYDEIEDMDEIFHAIKSEGSDPHEISIQAVSHIIDATKCFIYLKLKKLEDLKKIIEIASKVESKDKKFTNSIEICKSICWSIFHTKGQKAKEFIENAIKDNPNSDISYFILGKNLRRLRRDAVVESKPGAEETDAFEKAFEMSKNNVVFCLFLAQTLRESKKDEKAIIYYEKVLKLASEEKTDNNTIYLKTALGFLNCRYDSKREMYKYYDLAKFCLDKVSEEYLKNSMFLHYMGIYYMKTYKFREAVPYLKEAASTDNFGAAVHYVKCMLKLNPQYDFLKYLLAFEENKKNRDDKRIVQLYLHIAFGYLDYRLEEKSLEYFLKAIKFDPDSSTLKKYFGIPGAGFDNKQINIFKFVDNLLKKGHFRKNCKETQDMISELNTYCVNEALSDLKF